MIQRNCKKRLLLSMICVIFIVLAGCGKQENSNSGIVQQEEKVEFVPEEYNLLTAADGFAGGDGTEENPYQIATAEQMEYLSEVINKDWSSEEYSKEQNYKQGYYILTSDIELNDITNFENWETQAPKYEWKPIGSSAGKAFTGHFDGNGYVIKGIYIDNYSTFSNENISGDGTSIGLFGYLSHAVVKNVVIENSLIVANNDVSHAGSVVGHAMASEIINCNSTANLKINMAEHCGGIIGSAQKFENSEGEFFEQTIRDCIFEGTILFLNTQKEKTFDIGGVAGRTIGASVENCVNKGTIQVEGDCRPILHDIGGVIGTYNGGNSIMSDCVNEADIQIAGEPNLGGICGSITIGTASISSKDRTEETRILNCINSGKVVATGNESCVGGITGTISNLGGTSLLVENCTNSGEISGGLHVGGICGESTIQTVDWKLVNCINTGKVVSGLWSGGIIGYIGSCQMESVIKECINEGSVSGEGYVGGIAGGYFAYNVSNAEKRAPFSFTNCVNKGTVSQKENGILGVGGIVGYLQLDETTDIIYIDSCQNMGVVSGKEALRAGGILGGLSVVAAGSGGFCSITNCNNSGDIMQEGGTVSVTADLAMDSEPSFGNTEDKTWLIAGGSCIGGIVGYFKQGIIENCTNTGYFYINNDVIPMFNYDDMSATLADDAVDKLVFVGGICGLYYYVDGEEGYSSETCFVRNCKYNDIVPEGVVFALPDEASKSTVSNMEGIKVN